MGKLTVFATGVGSAGTLVGARRYFRRNAAPACRLVGAICAPGQRGPGVRSEATLREITVPLARVGRRASSRWHQGVLQEEPGALPERHHGRTQLRFRAGRSAEVPGVAATRTADARRPPQRRTARSSRRSSARTLPCPTSTSTPRTWTPPTSDARRWRRIAIPEPRLERAGPGPLAGRGDGRGQGGLLRVELPLSPGASRSSARS